MFGNVWICLDILNVFGNIRTYSDIKYSEMFRRIQTCSDMFRHVQTSTSSDIFRNVQTCSDMLENVQTRSGMFRHVKNILELILICSYTFK